jgi:hypothetical protein
MKPTIFFKNQIKLIANSALVICTAFGSVIALVATPSIGQFNHQQVMAASSEVLCWHIGMGSADFCDPFFDKSVLEFANLNR